MSSTFEDLRAEVENNGGLHVVDMGALRQLQGAGRLGVHVRDAITRALASHGMGHIPGELPSNQYDEVRLYVLASPIAEIVTAVLSPSAKGDEALRTVANSEAQEQLRQIREIVCG